MTLSQQVKSLTKRVLALENALAGQAGAAPVSDVVFLGKARRNYSFDDVLNLLQWVTIHDGFPEDLKQKSQLLLQELVRHIHKS